MRKCIAILCFTFLFINDISASNWLTSFEDAKKLALASNKFILVDFWATWCGPCKTMDSESWDKDEVRILMEKYISVKIDIDTNPNLARKYNVQGIPFIFIMDANGKVVYKQMSYKPKSAVIKLLKKYALNTSYMGLDLINYSKKSSYASAMRLGVKYQNYSMYVAKGGRRDFLSLAKIYFSETKKFLRKSELKNKDAFEQKIDLFFIKEKLFYKKPSKAIKLLNKYNLDEVDKINIKLYNFLYYTAYKQLKDNDNIQKWISKVTETDKKNAEKFLDMT